MPRAFEHRTRISLLTSAFERLRQSTPRVRLLIPWEVDAPTPSTHRARHVTDAMQAGIAEHLLAADPKLGQAYRPRRSLSRSRSQAPRPHLSRFFESIVYQQLHGKAAATIHARLLTSFEPICRSAAFHPDASSTCHRLPERAACAHRRSFSITKHSPSATLPPKPLDGTVPTLARIRRMSDEAIIEHLIQVRGIGRWTVEMMLIFRLGRPGCSSRLRLRRSQGIRPHLP